MNAHDTRELFGHCHECSSEHGYTEYSKWHIEPGMGAGLLTWRSPCPFKVDAPLPSPSDIDGGTR